MDPESLLDYALFQLTPTRTRCELVIVCRGRSEKLASGLVEPFVSHLKYAKDEIPKGGYSIKLSPTKSNPLWFTKSTFQRFVRFVRTPEVLERFSRLEKEILQIENSVQSNEFTIGNVMPVEEGNLSNVNGVSKHSPNSSKLKGDTDGTDEALQEENSKIALQRLLETRKALLRKEQAMAYARALAAGFELENLDDLIHFADTFGASRLREACTEFKDLCMKKHTDDLWMDELAAMKAMPQPELPFMDTSGIILAPEMGPYQNNTFNFDNNGKLMSHGSLDASSDSITSHENADGNKDNHAVSSDQTPPKGPMMWPNQMPPYLFNFQNPGQQAPPYQAYPFPIPPYYSTNMHWPQNADESELHRTRRSSSSRKKERKPNLEESEGSEPSNSDTESESEVIEKSHKKKHGKKSSKTVVIRNINYITSKKKNDENDGVSYDSSSGDEEAMDEDSFHQKVKDVLGTLEKPRKLKSDGKRRGGSNKNGSIVNGSADEELRNDSNVISSKGNENWDAFQNFLMSEKEPKEDTKPLDVLNEHFIVKRSNGGDVYGNDDSIHFDSEKIQTRKVIGTDSFIVSERSEVNQGGDNLKDFENGEVTRPNMKRSNYEDETLLFPQRSNETNSAITGKLSYIGSESTVLKSGNGDDWFVVNHSGKLENQESSFEQTMVCDSYALSSDGSREESRKIIPIDDSFMVQGHSPVDDQYDSHWKTDISLVSGMIATDQPNVNTCEEPLNKNLSGTYEPDDLCVVLARDPGVVSVEASWSAEVDYRVEASFTESVNKPVSVETDEKKEEKKPVNGKIPANGVAKQTRPKGLQGSLSKSRLDALSKSKKPTPISRSMSQKSKLEKEEEARRRAEELVIERQKRIAERSAAKKIPLGSKVTSPKISSPKTSITNGQVRRRTSA